MGGNLFFPRRKPNNVKQGRGSKTAKQMERHLKGVANHRRIEILLLIAREEGISVEGISHNLECNFKTISEHTRRLSLAGLIEKKYERHFVKHSLSPYGRIFVNFLNLFSNS